MANTSTMPAPAPQTNGHAASGTTTTTTSMNGQPVVQALPAFSDPAVLWSTGPSSATLLLQEAQTNLAQLRALKEHVQAGQLGYPLSTSPPSDNTLPPLPPVPTPSSLARHHHPASHAGPRVVTPELVPPIASASKLHGRYTVDECMKGFMEDNPGWTAHSQQDGAAICCTGQGMTVWATLRSSLIKDNLLVDAVLVFPASGKGKRKEIPQMSSPGWHVQLSNHLSSLDLPLSDLLYRIPHLPDLLRQPCYRCLRYIKVTDGMPHGNTGFLPAATAKPKHAEKHDHGTDERKVDGKWVCWHASCGDT